MNHTSVAKADDVRPADSADLPHLLDLTWSGWSKASISLN